MKLLIDNTKKIIYTETVQTTFANFFKYHVNTKEKLFDVLDELSYYLDNSYYFGLNYTNEGNDYYHLMIKLTDEGWMDENPFNWLLEYKELRNYTTPFFKIMTGNLNIIESVPDSIKEFFEPYVCMYDIPEKPNDVLNLHKRTLDKKFVCLNARVKDKYYRVSTFTFLKGMDLLKECNYSFNSRNDFDYHSIWVEDGDTINHLNQIDREYYIEKSPKDPFINSFCHIVNETYFNDEYDISFKDSFFMSEKIFKPIISCQPFLIISSPYYLKRLKEFGYKTFSDCWDERYDEIECGVTRLSEIYKIIIKISNMSMDECNLMYKKMIPILKHNYECTINFRKNNPQYNLPTITETINSTKLNKYTA